MSDCFKKFLPRLGLLLILGAWASSLQAADLQSDFMRANQLFAGDKFSEAAALYDSLIKNHGGSAALYYNLGNAHAREGNAGRAVLAYERGLLLSPRDAEIRANLEKVRQKNNLYEKVPFLWEQPFLMVARNTWASCLLLSLWLFSLLLSARLLLGKKAGRLSSFLLLSGAGFFLILSVLGGLGSFFQGKQADRAVVITQDLPLLISPFNGASASTGLKAGEVLNIGETHSEYVFVKNGEGKSGWVRQRDIERVQ